MKPFAVRWQNFRSFKDTDWITIKPITVLIGANASGKTSILAPLLMLKQTLESNDKSLPLRTTGELFNAGSYANLIHRHDSDCDLTLSFRRMPQPKQSKGLPPPNLFEFVFSKNPEEPALATLKAFKVLSADGRLLLLRERQSDGNYDISGCQITSAQGVLAEAILNTKPEYFLFPVSSILSAHFNNARKEEKEDKKAKTSSLESKIEIKGEEAKYLYILNSAAEIVDRSCSALSFIGPLREHPHRLYEVIGDDPKHVGIRGEYAPEILFRMRNSEIMNQVNDWIRKFDFGWQINCTEITSGAYSIQLTRAEGSPAVNLSDTGFGLSQILPIIVQCFFGRENDIIVMEQPEIHLNPRLQALLGDLFAVVASKGKAVVIETHSEHIILRLRRLIAEGTLKAEQVAVYYTDKNEDVSSIKEIPISDNGHINPKMWPEKFFEDTLQESFALAIAQNRRTSNVK
jgi:predicted ATPase